MAERKRLSARNHQEAYDLWASHFDDPALMTNRDNRATLKKMTHIAERLPISPDARLLDVGPGDGTLFRLLAPRVARCCGVDPSAAAVAKLESLLQDHENVEFRVGTAAAIPFEDDTFDIVVINSVLHMFETRDHIVEAMRDLARVCKADGAIYVGELPFRSELGKGVLRHLGRKLYEYGFVAFARLMSTIYLKPVLRGEPILTYPMTNLFVPMADFVALSADLGFQVQHWRHREWRRPSLTRNDYLLSHASPNGDPSPNS